MTPKTVLVVDDEVDIVETIKFNLENLENVRCVTAYDGKEAIQKVKKENPNLILLDVMLPKMSGYKVARLLKGDKATRNIPIILITARTQETDVIDGHEVGADAYVTKPFEIRNLIGLVEQHLVQFDTSWTE